MTTTTTTTAYLIRLDTERGLPTWLDQDRWTAEQGRATRYPTREQAERMAQWFLVDLRGRSDNLRGWSIEAAPAATCQWFLLCERPADTTAAHPILGQVPICTECAAKLARLATAA
jgi:hypothetical protein